MTFGRFDISLNGVRKGAEAIMGARANAPCVSDIDSLIGAINYWRQHYKNSAIEHAKRLAKLELVGDRDAQWERRSMVSDESDAAKCDAVISVLQWAANELRGRV